MNLLKIFLFVLLQISFHSFLVFDHLLLFHLKMNLLNEMILFLLLMKMWFP